MNLLILSKILLKICCVIYFFLVYYSELYHLLYDVYSIKTYKYHWKTIYKGRKVFMNIFVLYLLIMFFTSF